MIQPTTPRPHRRAVGLISGAVIAIALASGAVIAGWMGLLVAAGLILIVAGIVAILLIGGNASRF